MSSIDNDEERVMHSNSNNIEITINDEPDEVIEEHFKSLKNRYQNNLESIKVIVSLSLIMFIYCTLYVINKSQL